ncbi:ATP synthase regulation protein NCA2-domain-containing protein [Cyathus striatus]|nr:ATP synthase regulation protein NCA2-domain-containing protein [Cyathus striatus]
MPSRFVDNFTKSLTRSRPVSPSPAAQSHVSSQTPVASTDTATLHALFYSLTQAQHPSLSLVSETLNTLLELDTKTKAFSTTSLHPEEEVLKHAIISKLVVSIYAESLDLYLNQAIQVEADAEWWADVERSRLNVAWYLLQSMFFFFSPPFPSRLADLVHTILQKVRARQLPIRLSLFTPSSLQLLFPSSDVLRPSALTTALFPHLSKQPFSIPSSAFLFPFTPAPKEDDRLSIKFTGTVYRYIYLVASYITFPLELTRQECSHNRRELEKIRDEKAEVLGKLAQLRGSLAKAIEDAQRLLRPSRWVLLWPKLLLLPPLALYGLKSIYASRATLYNFSIDAKETVEGFIKGWLIEPIRDVLKTVRAGGEEAVLVHKEGVAAELDSLERMSLSLARDELHYNDVQLAELSQRIRVGDLTPILEIYEADIRRPVRSAVTGTLLRSVFIQVQKAKVDIDQALAGIDKLLKSQELTFAFVGVAPALAILYLAGGILGRVYGGAQGRGRRIERLLNQSGSTSQATLSPLLIGLLLLNVTRLRQFADAALPSNSRLYEGFLEDVDDLEDPELGRDEKMRVVERMWRCWSGVLGWGRVVDGARR